MSEKTSLIEEAIKASKKLTAMVENNQESTLKRHLVDAFSKKLKESEEEKIEETSKEKELPQHFQEEKMRKHAEKSKGSLKEQDEDEEDVENLEPETEVDTEIDVDTDEVETDMEIDTEVPSEMKDEDEMSSMEGQTIDLTGLDDNLAIKVIMKGKDEDEVVIVKDEEGEVQISEAAYKNTVAKLIKEGYLDEGDLEIDITHDDEEYDTEVEELDETDAMIQEMMKEMEEEDMMEMSMYDEGMAHEGMEDIDLDEMMMEMEMEEDMMTEQNVRPNLVGGKFAEPTIKIGGFVYDKNNPKVRNMVFSVFMHNNGYGLGGEKQNSGPDFSLTLQNMQSWFNENFKTISNRKEMYANFASLPAQFNEMFNSGTLLLTRGQVDELINMGAFQLGMNKQTESTSVGYNNARAQTVKPRNYARPEAVRPAMRKMYESYKNVVAENKIAKVKIKKLEEALKEVVGSLKESTLAAANTHYFNMLLLDHNVSENNRIKIMEKFDNSASVEESKKLYEAINKKLADKAEKLQENIENFASTNEKGKQIINEARIYEAYASMNDSSNNKDRIKKLMGI